MGKWLASRGGNGALASTTSCAARTPPLELLPPRVKSLFRRLPPEVAPPIEPLFPSHVRAVMPASPAVRASLHHLRTGRGTWLAAGESRIEMEDAAEPDRAIVALCPYANPQLVFLLAPDLRVLSVRGDGLKSVAISAFRLQTEHPSIVRLRHPLAPRRFMGVTQDGQGAPRGCVIFESLGQNKLDLLERVEVNPGALPPSFHVAAAELCAAVARPFQAARLLDLLYGGALRAEFAAPLIRVLPRDELGVLARLLLERPEDLALLCAAMPEDPWFARALPALADWQGVRPAVAGGVLRSPAEDEFAADPWEGFGQPQAGFAVTALARGHMAPRRGACLLAAAFEHAFIYATDNFDGSDAMLEALGGAGVITLVHNQAGSRSAPQNKAYAHALALLPQLLDYAWAAILDVDEYFAFDTRLFRGVEDFLAWHETQPVDAIALCRMMFVAARGETWRDAPSLARFTRREKAINRRVKSIFRPRKFWGAQQHFPFATLNAPIVFRTESGGVHHHMGVADREPVLAASPTAELAWVNHYWLRSAPEALWKLARGHGDWKGETKARQMEMATQVCRGFVSLADSHELVEDRRILACAAGMDAELAALRALPGVAAADARVKADFSSRLVRMTAAFVEQGGREEPASFGPFREVLVRMAK
jgi:Glycosyl transferase family 2